MGQSDIFLKLLLHAGHKYTLSKTLDIPLVIIGMTLRFRCLATFDTVKSSVTSSPFNCTHSASTDMSSFDSSAESPIFSDSSKINLRNFSSGSIMCSLPRSMSVCTASWLFLMCLISSKTNGVVKHFS